MTLSQLIALALLVLAFVLALYAQGWQYASHTMRGLCVASFASLVWAMCRLWTNRMQR